MDILNFLNSSLGLLLTGFFMTSLLGGILTSMFQKRAWKRQAYLDLYKKKYDDGLKYFDELSELIGKRFFHMQKMLWAISSQNENLVTEREKQYEEVLFLWNSNYYKNRNKLHLLINEEAAKKFLDYEDNDIDNPQSLHYKFVVTHRKIIEAKNDFSKLKTAEDFLTNLNLSSSSFIQDVTAEFSQRAEKLQLLDEIEIKKGF